MVSAGSWRDHFKVDDNILTAFWEEFSESSPIRASEMSFESAANSIEFLLWCVREGHFSEEAFIQFQARAYNLPVVSHGFFESPIDREFWERVKDIHPWSAQCLPLTEWDGTLLIAAVSPEEKFKPSIHHRLVLAAPTQLREYYTRLETPKVSLSESAQGQDQNNVDPFEALTRSFGFSADPETSAKVDEPSEDSSNEIVAPEGLIIPAGLDLSSREVENEIDLDATQPSAVVHAPEPPPPIQAPAARVASAQTTVAQPTGQTTSRPTAPAFMPFKPVGAPEPPASPAPPALQKPSLTSVETASQPEAEQQAPSTAPPLSLATEPVAAKPVNEATVVVKADEMTEARSTENSVVRQARKPLFEPTGAAHTSPAPHLAAPHLSAPANQTAGMSNTGTGTPSRVRRLESTPVTSFFGLDGKPMSGSSTRPNRTARNPENYLGKIVTVSKLDPLHLDQCTSIDEAGAQALLQVCNIYETAMILLFKDGELQPWKWNDLFLSVKGDKPDAVELKEPSIFKVVFRTAKPYHGYVVTNPVNQKFFNEFNRGLVPKHASVIPIMIDGRMGGMLLGFTNMKVDYRQSLRLMERLSYDLSRIFKSLRGTMSRAS